MYNQGLVDGPGTSQYALSLSGVAPLPSGVAPLPSGLAPLPPTPGSSHGSPTVTDNIAEVKTVILNNPTTKGNLPSVEQVYNDDNQEVEFNLENMIEVNAKVLVDEGVELISLAGSAAGFGGDPDYEIASNIMYAVDNNIDIDTNKPNLFLVNDDRSGRLQWSTNTSFSPLRTQNALENDTSILDMFENIKIESSTSTVVNDQIDKVLTEYTGVASILATRDNTTATRTASKPNAPAQMGYIWGVGIVNWVRSNDPHDVDNVCYLCGEKMGQGNPTGIRTTDDWDYPEVEHKIPCTTAFTLFPSMDNLRWYYPYFTVDAGLTSRANAEYRAASVRGNDKSMLAWWVSFTPTSGNAGSTLTRDNAEKGTPFADNKSILSSDKFEYLRQLYISINRDRNTDINSPEYNNVKNLFKRFIKEKYGSSGGFNETVFNYSWNVICLWLMEFAGSHKTCNQRKSQYNLMTKTGRANARQRTYNGGIFRAPQPKKEIDLKFNVNNDSRINQTIISRHLLNIKSHYEICCGLYRNVSATDTLKGIRNEDRLNVYIRMHIWDNFRRIISYVTHIREEYFKTFSQSSNGIDKIERAIVVLNDKIVSIDQHKKKITDDKRVVMEQIKSRRVRQAHEAKIARELAALETELNDINTEITALDTKNNKLKADANIICGQAKEDKKAARAEMNNAKRALDEMVKKPNKKRRKRGGGGNYEDAVQRLRHAENELKYATSICNKACGLAGRSCDTVSGRPAAGLASSENPIRDRTGIRMQELIEGRGGTRRKRRRPKSKRTRRVRKSPRKSKRTRRARKSSRKKKTRRRSKK